MRSRKEIETAVRGINDAIQEADDQFTRQGGAIMKGTLEWVLQEKTSGSTAIEAMLEEFDSFNGRN